MSISHCVFLLFLCVSFHACNAGRRLGAIDKKLESQFHANFNKNDENKGADKIPVETWRPKLSSLSNELEAAKENSLAKKQSSDDDQKQENGKAVEDYQKISSKDEEGKTLSGAVQTESLSSVYWHLPHYIPGEKHPGFNSDYSPPKTHPPTHN